MYLTDVGELYNSYTPSVVYSGLTLVKTDFNVMHRSELYKIAEVRRRFGRNAPTFLRWRRAHF